MFRKLAMIFMIFVTGVAGSFGVHVEAAATVVKPGWDLSAPLGLAADDGKLYVTDLGNQRIQIFNQDESVYKTLGEKGVSGADNAHFNIPKYVAVEHSTKNIYVFDAFNNRIQEFNSEGGWLRSISLPNLANPAPEAMTLDENGHIFFSDQNWNRVYRMDIETGVYTPVASTSDRPMGVAVDSEGNLYISQYWNHIVLVFQHNGDDTYTQVKMIGVQNVSGNDNSHLNSPMGLYIDGKDRLYIADSNNKRVQVFNKDGSYTLTLGHPDLQLPRHITVDDDENIYVADGDTNKIFMFDGQGTFKKILGQNTIPAFIGTESMVTVAQDSDPVDLKPLLHVSDPDPNQTLTWTLISSPVHGTVSISGANAPSGSSDIVPGGTVSYTPAEGYYGTDWLAVQVSDGNGGVAAKNITVSVKERLAAPTANPASGTVLANHSLVTLGATSPGAAIYYTTDGTNPSADSPRGPAVTITGTPGSTVTLKAIAVKDGSESSEVATFTYTIAHTFSIEPISDMTLPELVQGYGSLEAEAIRILNTGTIGLSNLSVSLGGVHANAFDFTLPLQSTLDPDASTTFAIQAKPGLAAGTYTATVTVSADNMASATFTVTQVVGLPDISASPLNLAATAGDRQVDLRWDTVTGATYYNLYMSTTPGEFDADSIATVTSATYLVPDLNNGTTYYFVVRAGNDKGLGSESNQVSATPATLPSAPTDVTAEAGKGSAKITFTAPKDNGGSAITGYEVFTAQGALVATGDAGSSSITVPGLLNGTTYTFIMKAKNAVGSSAPSAPSNAVTPRDTPGSDNGNSGTHIGSGNNHSNSSSQPAPEQKPEQENTGGDVLVNGKLDNVGTASIEDVNGQKIMTITVNEEKLRQRLTDEGKGATITLSVSAGSDVVVGEFNGRMIKNMETEQAVVVIRTEKATYTLPAEQIDIDSISERFGKDLALQDIKVKIEISEPQAETVRTVETAAERDGLTLVVPPLNFKVSAVYGDRTEEAAKFNAYVERALALPEGIDPNRITTGVVVEPDGFVRHVPTKVIKEDGIYYAKINSLTNSTYAVVWHPLAFKDMENHWAKNYVNDMGSRMIAGGTGDDLFSPDREITRAEFAAIIVRGLGLGVGAGASSFTDVKAADWYSGAVNTAYEYGLIKGYTDGTFRPDGKITREEAMAIVANAMKITGLKDRIASGSSLDAILQPYQDETEISAWATAGVADTVQAGIVSGRNNMNLEPKAFITRAEIAAIIKRLLEKSDLI